MEYFSLLRQKDQVLVNLQDKLQCVLKYYSKMRRHQHLTDYLCFILTRAAEQSRHLETNAVINIQRVFRGSKKREFIAYRHKNATSVQRAFRGHTSRKRVNFLKFNEANVKKAMLFHCFALILQKNFRGFYSRKYRASHFKRKEFIEKIATTATRIREMQYEYSIQQAMVRIF